ALSPYIPRVSMGAAAGKRALADLLEWQPELGSFIGVAERERGQFRWVPAPAMLVAAIAQAFDDGDDLVIDLCTHPDPAVVSAATEIMQGTLRSPGYATLERVRVGPDGHVTRELLPPLDHPQLAAPRFAGPDARIFGLNLNPVAGFPGTL